MSNPTTSLVRVEPVNMTELERFSAAAAKSGLFGAKSPEAALMIAMRGRSLGLDYSTALAAMHVIEGRPTLSADAMVAICLARPDICEAFDTLESTNERCIVEAKRRGKPARKHEFSMDDAKRAGLAGKAMWAKYPRNMLRARAKSELARDMFPDLLLGLYTADEVSDGTASIDMGEPSEPSQASRAPYIDAEVIEAPKAKPRRTLASVYPDLDAADVDGWLLSLNRPLMAGMLDLEPLLAALAPGQAGRKRYDDWAAARAAEAAAAGQLGD